LAARFTFEGVSMNHVLIDDGRVENPASRVDLAGVVFQGDVASRQIVNRSSAGLRWVDGAAIPPGDGCRVSAAAIGASDGGRSSFPNPDAAGLSVPPASDSTDPVRDMSASGVGRSEYPVPGRSPEYNRRIAIHEGAGHAYLARCMGTELHSVSIIPGDGFEGRCLSKAYQSSLYEAPTDSTVEIVDLCERAQRLMPELGTGRVEAAEFFQRATVLCIELVGGSVAEQILHPQDEPLPTFHDQIEAAAFAAIAVASPRAVPAFLEYAKGEAEALINDHPDVAMAIAEGLIEHGVLTGDQVDEIIVAAMSRETLKAEAERRAKWAGVLTSAAEFTARENGMI
jgi:hypothetical protein